MIPVYTPADAKNIGKLVRGLVGKDYELFTEKSSSYPTVGTMVTLGKPGENFSDHLTEHPSTENKAGLELIAGPSVPVIMRTPKGLELLRRSLNLHRDKMAGTLPDHRYLYDVIGRDEGHWHAGNLTNNVRSCKRLYVDIEVSGDIRVDEPEDTELLSVAVLFERQWGQDPYRIGVWSYEYLQTIPGQRELSTILLCGTPLVLHNGQFDVRWLNYHLRRFLYGKTMYPSEDTLLMHYRMFPGAAGDHGLKDLAQKILGAPEWEKEIKKYTNGKAHYERIPKNLLYAYNAGDVYWTWKLFHVFDQWMDESPPHIRELYRELLMPMSKMFVDIESPLAPGYPVDIPLLQKMDAEHTQLANRQRAKIQDAVGDPVPYLSVANAAMRERWLRLGKELRAQHEFNPGSAPQVKKWLEAQLDHPVIGTGEEPLKELIAEGVPPKVKKFIGRMQDYRHTTKMQSTYVKKVLTKARRGAVRPSGRVAGTVTGRLAFDYIQTVPRPEGGPYRKPFIAGPGYKLLSVDYGQIELRIVAEVADDKAMIDALQLGRPDFFTGIMPAAYPRRYTTVKQAFKHKAAEPVVFSELRTGIKRIVHGANYGRRPAAMARQLEIPQQQANDMYYGYMRSYPGVGRWQDSVMAFVRGEDKNEQWDAYGLWTPLGRRFQQGVITESTAWNIKNAALAFVPQSTGSDICMMAALELHERWRGTDVRLCAFIHDALYAIAPENKAEAKLAEMQEVMSEMAKKVFTRVPFPTDGHIGENWLEVS